MTKKERTEFTKAEKQKHHEAIADFEHMRYMAEAKAYQSLSQKRPLTKEEFSRYKTVCEKVGIRASVPKK